MRNWVGYVGTQKSSTLPGIGQLCLHRSSGAVSVRPFWDVPEAKYLAAGDGILMSILRREAGSGICTARLQDGQIAATWEILDQPAPGCYVALDGRWAYTADFHTGMVCCYELSEGKPLRRARRELGEGVGCHQALFYGDTVLVPCLERDWVEILRKESLDPVGRIAVPPGSGPRHGIMDRDCRRLYVVGQKDNCLHGFDVEGLVFRPACQIPLLDRPLVPQDEAAAIRFSPDEKFLYVSVRGADQIAVLSCEGSVPHLVQRCSCGGTHPRDMVLSPDGAFLLVANRFEGGVVSIRRDPASGRLGEICGRAEVDDVVSIVWNTEEKG